MSVPSRLRALFVTGAYRPEFSAGGLQCEAVARVIKSRVPVDVLTTATNPHLPVNDVIEGVPVTRVHVDAGGSAGIGASVMMASRLMALLRSNELVHIQGVSTKNVLITWLSRLAGRPVIVHLQTARHDEPPAIKAQGSLAWRAFASANRYISVSPALKAAAVEGGIAPAKIDVIPNGVDARRFRPATDDERSALRAELGLPVERPLILFVGVIAPDKQPQVLLDAWASLQGDPAMQSTLVFVGATNPALYELGDNLAATLRARLVELHLDERVRFVEPTNVVEKYFRSADLLVMPSLREGCPNVLLEAMACGLPVVASRLPGSTDAIINDGVNGLLVEVGDVGGFADGIRAVLRDAALAARLGGAARQTILDRFTIETVAEQWLRVYEDVVRTA